MSEISEELVKKLDLKNPSKRQEYLSLIDRLLEMAYTKSQNKYCKNSERLSWIRAIAALVRAGSAILNDADLEDALRRIERLEEARKHYE